MQVGIDTIGPKGRQVQLSPSSPWGDVVASSLDLTVASLDGTLDVKRTARGASVVIRATASGTHLCDRCGQPTPLSVEVDTTLAYRPSAELDDGQEEVELSEGDLDVGFFDGVTLDLTDVVAEGFALAAPDRVTCDRSDCGDTVGDASDGQDGASSSPFAALKDLL